MSVGLVFFLIFVQNLEFVLKHVDDENVLKYQKKEHGVLRAELQKLRNDSGCGVRQILDKIHHNIKIHKILIKLGQIWLAE